MEEFENVQPLEGTGDPSDMDATMREAIGDVDADIDQAMQEAINEEVADGIKDAIEGALREEGIPDHKIMPLTAKGYELLTKEPNEKESTDESKDIPETKRAIGHEGTPKPYNYPDKPEDIRKNMPWPSGKNTAQLSQRERLEAMKEGLEEFLSQPHKTRQQEEATIDELEGIEQQLSRLPPDPPEPEEPEIEDFTNEEAKADGWRDAKERKNWLEATQGYNEMLDKLPKEGKKQYIKDMYSTGIGFNGLGELMDDIDNTIDDMGTMF